MEPLLHNEDTASSSFPEKAELQNKKTHVSLNGLPQKMPTLSDKGLTPPDPQPLSRPEDSQNQNALLLAPVSGSFPFFAGLSLAFGLLFTFCLYQNPCGITYPVFIAVSCLFGVLICQKLHISMKKGSWFVLAAALLIGISTCRTADTFLISINKTALLLLGCIFSLHQFYEDKTWNIGKYLTSVFLQFVYAVGAIAFPFRHFRQYLKTQDNKIVRQIPTLFLGFLAALPILALLTSLLGQADAIFSDLMQRIFHNFLRPFTLFDLLFRTIFGTLSLYCLVCACCLHKISQENADRRKGSPFLVVTGLSMTAVIYVVFCSIQVVYLFLGKGNLPDGYTYSSYARQGFFQLLLVASLNLAMVLCCLKYVRPHKALNIILTLICLCTYIMIASACYRLMLYVRQYHLSYLRLLALWFLAVLAILMAGVTWLIWNQKFPLFRYSLAAVSLCYVLLAWARPDSVIAWNYVNHLDSNEVSQKDLYYLNNLSADAAPAFSYLIRSQEQNQNLDQEILLNLSDYYYNYHAWPQYQTLGIRNYNFSFAQAKKLFFKP